MKPKKYMIRCDIEGVSGVVSYAQAEPGKPEFDIGLRMFRSDLCACIDGLLDGGADEIVIYDEHFYGRNIDPEWLPEGVSFIAGKPPYRTDWAGGLDESFAGLVLLGFHSKYGTPGGLLHHSYELDIRDLRLNGVSVGEIGMETAIAGDFGVPLVLMTGDSAGCLEAETLVSGVQTVAVKESLGETGGQCHPLSLTRSWIHAAAKAVAAKAVEEIPPAAEPWRCNSPVTLEVSLNPGPYADAVLKQNSSDYDEGDLVLHGDNATAVWADYWQRKLKAQDKVIRDEG
jgi:D-amino peptidase